MSAAVSVDEERKTMLFTVGFQTAKYSERYQVSIQSHGFHYSKNVSKVIILNRTLYCRVHTQCQNILSYLLLSYIDPTGEQNLTECDL